LITADYSAALANDARASEYAVLRKPIKPAALRASSAPLQRGRRPSAILLSELA
jgi:hypothetical protein